VPPTSVVLLPGPPRISGTAPDLRDRLGSDLGMIVRRHAEGAALETVA